MDGMVTQDGSALPNGAGHADVVGVEVLASDFGTMEQNDQFSGYFGRRQSNLTSGRSRQRSKAGPVTKMHEFPNMSAFAILDRRAEVRKENLSKSRHTMNEIAK